MLNPNLPLPLQLIDGSLNGLHNTFRQFFARPPSLSSLNFVAASLSRKTRSESKWQAQTPFSNTRPSCIRMRLPYRSSFSIPKNSQSQSPSQSQMINTSSRLFLRNQYRHIFGGPPIVRSLTAVFLWSIESTIWKPKLGTSAISSSRLWNWH